MQKFDPFAVTFEGMHLVEASAGTGKTYNITSMFTRCLIEERAGVDEILILTYTNAATEELKERILNRLRESLHAMKYGSTSVEDEFLDQLLARVSEPEKAVKIIETALRNFDEAPIFTIHGFCQRALLEQSFLSGIPFGGELLPDESEFVQDAVEDYWRKMVGAAEEDSLERAWFNIIREEGYRTDELTKIVKKGIGKPYLELTPTSSGRRDRRKDIKGLLSLFAKLKILWPDNRDELKGLLLSDAMNGNRYRRSSVGKWFLEMDKWLEGEFPILSPFDRFDRFSISFIKNFGVNKGKEVPVHPFFDTVEKYITYTNHLRIHLIRFKIKLIEDTAQKVIDNKVAAGVLGYDDLLIFLNESLNRPADSGGMAEYLRTRYPVAMVDEFQDTDPIQYQILSSIYGQPDDRSALFLIGDPKQSIYSFRGADVFSYLEARSAIPENNKYGLGRNFRSGERLIQAVNKLFGRLKQPFLVREIVFEPATPGKSGIASNSTDQNDLTPIRFLYSSSMNPDLQLTKSECGSRAAEVTAESISRSLSRETTQSYPPNDRSISAKDIAVLVRTHKQADLIKNALSRRDIKSVLYSKKSVFKTEEARDMIALLKAMAEPGNESLIRIVLSSNLFPHTAADLVQLQENEQQWLDIIGLFGELNKIWNRSGFAKAFRRFLVNSRMEQEVVLRENGERKLTNFLQLGELLQAHERERSPGPFELIRWLVHKRHEPVENSDEELLRLESDEELVKIVTLHRSKGLEYPVTYCPFLWHGMTVENTGEPFVYHNPENNYNPCLDLGEKGGPDRDLHRYWAAIEEISEAIRLAYVALTRAKRQCTIVFEPCSGIEYSSLGYLLLGNKPLAERLEEKILSGNGADPVPADLFFTTIEQLAKQEPLLFGCEQLDEGLVTKVSWHSRSLATSLKPNRLFSQYESTRSAKYVSSFSSIMHPTIATNAEDELISGEFYLYEELAKTSQDTGRTIFSFPKGPNAGTCVHKIFEEIRFNRDPDQSRIVEKHLENFGFDISWSETIDQMVTSVLDRDLAGGMRLSGVAQGDAVKEMEFYFDLNPFLRNEIIRAIRDDPGGTDPDIKIPGGFMKGYIDLVFRHEGRYYIADYKTNHLGDEQGDYSANEIKEEILIAGYDVQYHIYLLALHRFLQRRLKHYSYNEHIGGVYYLFVRGMADGENREGVFFDRPGQATMDRLDKLFLGGGSH